MTIPSDLTKLIFAGNDSTTVFPYTFKIFANADMEIILTDSDDVETILILDVDYSITGAGEDSGGNVTYPLTGDPLATGEKLTLYRDPDLLQAKDLQNQGGFHAQVHENAFDLLTMLVQNIAERVLRSFTLPVSDQSGASTELPVPAANKVIGWDSTGLALENIDPGSVALAIPASDVIFASMINAAGTQVLFDKLFLGNTAKWVKGANVASAAALPLLEDGNYVHVTGTTTITSMNTVDIGTVMILEFDGSLTLTHHATDLILPNNKNIITRAGDIGVFIEYASGDWKLFSWFSNTQTVLGLQRWNKGVDIASAATLALGNDGNYFNVTGSTGITQIGTKGIGTVVSLEFDAALVLTHHATNLKLPGDSDITTIAGDIGVFVEYASGDWKCVDYHRSSYVTQQPISEFVDGTLATVTVLATETDLLSIDLGTVKVGERWLIHQTNNEVGAAGIWTKGATGGQTYAYVKKASGTAVAKFSGATLSPAFMKGQDVIANDTWSSELSGVIEITTGGTLVLKYSGKSAGSNSTVWTNAVLLHAIKIKDA